MFEINFRTCDLIHYHFGLPLISKNHKILNLGQRDCMYIQLISSLVLSAFFLDLHGECILLLELK